jgi:hypothetical protein
VKVTVQRKFKINGQEYTSIDQIPPEYRGAVERALAKRRSKALGWVIAALGLAAMIALVLMRAH